MAGVGGNGVRRARFEESQQTEEQREDDDHPGMLKPQSTVSSTDEQEPFMGVKMRRRSSMYRTYKGYYLDDASKDGIQELLTKHGPSLSLSLGQSVTRTERDQCRCLTRKQDFLSNVVIFSQEMIRMDPLCMHFHA
jgi:hypothetical protein